MISLIIRTLNEQEQLSLLLSDLLKQNYHREHLQIIVVDNQSSDNTVPIAKNFGCQVINIPRDEFTYPRSLNLGVKHAKHEIVILTVGHARLFQPDWLATSEKTFQDPQIAGLYSPILPLTKSSLVEKLFYWPGYMQAKLRGPYLIRHRLMGVLGATNCAIRKSLWDKHQFDESYEAGGEDGEWAAWVMEQGFAICCDWRFSVRHSHGLNLKGLKQQIGYWSELSQPKKFSREELLRFRHDLNFD